MNVDKMSETAYQAFIIRHYQIWISNQNPLLRGIFKRYFSSMTEGSLEDTFFEDDCPHPPQLNAAQDG